MTTQRRSGRKSNIQLESLESREAPAVGISSAWLAAISQAQTMEPHAIRFPGVLRALPISRPGTAYQGPIAVSLGGASNTNGAAGLPWTFGGTGRAMNSPFALAQARRAAVHANLPTMGAGAVNRPWFNTAWAIRSAMRTPQAPVTLPSSNLPTTPMPTSDTPTGVGTSDQGTTQNLPPNVSGVLNTIYQNFLTNSNQPVGTGPGSIQIDGSNVGVNIHGNGRGDFSGFVSTLQNLGMQITSTSDVTWTVSGMLPINQLLTAAQTPQTLSITPRLTPMTM